MDLVRSVAASDLRRRWRSWLVLVVVIGIVGGTAMAAVAGWARTESAMDRFLGQYRPFNAYAEGVFTTEEIEAIEGVDETAGGDYFLLVPIDARGDARPEHLGMVSPFSTDNPAQFRTVERPLVVEGVLADPAVETEVVVDEEMAEMYGLRPGSALRMQAYSPDQTGDLYSGIGSLVPEGAVFDFTVTGVIRQPQDVVRTHTTEDVVYLGSAAVFLGPAFDAAHRGKDVPSLGVLFGDARPPGANAREIRIDFDRVTPDEVEASIRRLDPDAFVEIGGGDADRAAAEVNRSVGIQASLLAGLGAVLAAGGALLVAQGLRRQLESDRETRGSLRVLGATRRQLSGVAAIKALVIASSGALVATVAAIALSTFMPVGFARRVEIDPGIDVDAARLGVAAAVLFSLVAVSIVVVSQRPPGAARDRSGTTRRSSMSERAGQAGLSPSMVAGVRAADLGAGRGIVAITVFVAVAGVVGALGFSSSEQHLATEPDLWGWTFDLVVGDGNDPEVRERADRTFADDPDIDAYASIVGMDALTLGSGGARRDVPASAIDDIEGTIEPRMLEGDPPVGDDEIALGAVTARKLGVSVGDAIEVDGGGGPHDFTVSGFAVLNLGFDAERVGEGAMVAPSGVERLGLELAATVVVVDLADGVDVDEAATRLRKDWGNTVLRPTRPLDVDQLHRVRHLPLWFGAVLGIVAAVTLAFALVITIRRRGADLAVLRTLGFERRHVRTTVLSQALTLVVPGALLGAVVGVGIGRQAWALTARALGAPEVHSLPIPAAGLVVFGAVALALVVAAVPARLAATSTPAALLRTE